VNDHDHTEPTSPGRDGSFDERAATWDDDPGHRDRARAVAAAIRDQVHLTPSTRVIEYGAGTGLLAEELASDVGPVTVTDPSAGMREVIAAKVAAGVLPGAVVSDLDLERDAVPDGRYDLVVTVMALHHVTDVRPVLAGFAALLEPGGVVAIADLDAEDGSFHSDHTDFHGHDGFDRDELTRQLTEAGFDAIGFVDATEIERDGRTYGVFLATARRT
jgi:2-polyprenyl-3-methyl-5-hydroxy-6-metoxy-1,4-benzoquinol methylase